MAFLSSQENTRNRILRVQTPSDFSRDAARRLYGCGTPVIPARPFPPRRGRTGPRKGGMTEVQVLETGSIPVG